MANPILATTAVGVVPPARSGMGSGINNTFRQIGIATGIAGLGAIFQHQVSTRLVDVRAVTPGYPLYGEIISAPASAWAELHRGRNVIVDRVVRKHLTHRPRDRLPGFVAEKRIVAAHELEEVVQQLWDLAIADSVASLLWATLAVTRGPKQPGGTSVGLLAVTSDAIILNRLRDLWARRDRQLQFVEPQESKP